MTCSGLACLSAMGLLRSTLRLTRQRPGLGGREAEEREELENA